MYHDISLHASPSRPQVSGYYLKANTMGHGNNKGKSTHLAVRKIPTTAPTVGSTKIGTEDHIQCTQRLEFDLEHPNLEALVALVEGTLVFIHHEPANLRVVSEAGTALGLVPTHAEPKLRAMNCRTALVILVDASNARCTVGVSLG